MNYFKKLLDVICFVFGPSLLIISIFSFNHKGLIGIKPIILSIKVKTWYWYRCCSYLSRFFKEKLEKE